MPQTGQLIKFFDPDTNKEREYKWGARNKTSQLHKKLVLEGKTLAPEGFKVRENAYGDLAFIKLSKKDVERSKRKMARKEEIERRASQMYRDAKNIAERNAKDIRRDSKNLSTIQVRARIFVHDDTDIRPSSVEYNGKTYRCVSSDLPITFLTSVLNMHVRNPYHLGTVIKPFAWGKVTDLTYPDYQQFVSVLRRTGENSGVEDLIYQLMGLLENTGYPYEWGDMLVVFDQYSYSNNLTATPVLEPADTPLTRSGDRIAISGDQYDYVITPADTFREMLIGGMEVVDFGRCLFTFFISTYKHAHAKSVYYLRPFAYLVC